MSMIYLSCTVKRFKVPTLQVLKQQTVTYSFKVPKHQGQVHQVGLLFPSMSVGADPALQ